MQPQHSVRPDNPLLLSQGYGFIPKAVMTDRRLSASAKALYAYLCSFAGKGGAAWPSVERICGDLGFGPTVFRAGLKRLVEFGYVTAARERRMNRFTRYCYSLAGAQAAAAQPAEKSPVEALPAAPEPAAGEAASKNNVRNNTFKTFRLEEEEPSPQTRAGEQCPDGVPENAWIEIGRRRAAGDTAAQSARVPGGPGSGGGAVAQWFLGAYGRPPNAAEVSKLLELLALCSPGALRRMIEISAVHAPAAPALYVRRMAQRFRAGAASMGLLPRPSGVLTEEMIERVEDRDRPFG